MIKRTLESKLRESLVNQTRKVIVLYGPRQVGKTTLIRKIFDSLDGQKLFLNADFLDDQALLTPERASLDRVTSGLDYLFVDEAQNIKDIGTVLKLLHDSYPTLRVVATGSSSFDLSRKTGAPLTGRQVCFSLFPISFAELDPDVSAQTSHIAHALVYGSYPELLQTPNNDSKEQFLRQLVTDYLLRDIFQQVDVNRLKLNNLLRLLAFQVGSEVSFNELASQVQLDVKTVAKYIGYLEEAFVLIRLGGFSRNLRKEVSKAQKYYFYDCGVRNGIINAFQPLVSRNDVGALWENFLVIERKKALAYRSISASHYFWRTYDRQEIDLIEQTGDKLAAFEFKFSDAAKAKIPNLWKETYPDSTTDIITPKNATTFLR